MTPTSWAVFDDADMAFLSGPQLPAHVYIHLPFCKSKCSYCDFVSFADATDERVAAVAEGIHGEILRWAASSLPGVVETLYVGGGTPTFVAPQAARIIEQATETLPVRGNAEITVEANPDSMSAGLAVQLRSLGVTRLSLGVQSFDDGVLRMLGRIHDSAAAMAAAEAAVDAGLELAVDLMCGVPGQTISSWQETLDHALRSGARHISVYPLSLEAGTPLAVACDGGLVDDVEPDLAADMMLLAEDVLSAAGLLRYEIANYAAPDAQSRHNTAYWTGRSYLGIGPGAHGMLDEPTARAVGMLQGALECPVDEERIGRVRYNQDAELHAWLFDPQGQIEFLTPAEARREDVMLRMRLVAGVGEQQARDAGLEHVFGELARQALVERVGESAASGHDSIHWRLTRRGWLLGNEVFARIWSPD